MHDHTLSSSLQNGLGVYYLIVAAMNFGFAAFFYSMKNMLQVLIWALVGGLFLLHGVAYFAHAGWIIPEGVQDFVNTVMNPVSYFVVAVLVLVLGLYFRRFFTDPVVA